MGRGLPQEVIKRAQKEVSLEDRFCFECKRCGDCCFCCEIVLTPYDILRLCQGLRMTTGEFLDRYGQITLGPESGLPVCWLGFEKVQRSRGGDEQSPSHLWYNGSVPNPEATPSLYRITHGDEWCEAECTIKAWLAHQSIGQSGNAGRMAAVGSIRRASPVCRCAGYEQSVAVDR